MKPGRPKMESIEILPFIMKNKVETHGKLAMFQLFPKPLRKNDISPSQKTSRRKFLYLNMNAECAEKINRTKGSQKRWTGGLVIYLRNFHNGGQGSAFGR